MSSSTPTRRGLFKVGVGGGIWAAAPAARAAAPKTIAELAAAPPPPDQAPAREGMVNVPGGRIWFWDTGGAGQPIVLAHPASGSAEVWLYQQPAFARAGYRVIGYSRRGFQGSETEPNALRSESVAELDALVAALSLTRFHGLGVAAGGGVLLRYAVARPRTVRSLMIASSLGDVDDPEYTRASRSLRPAPFDSMPAEFRELGPCYRAANPEGVARWVDLYRRSRAADAGPLGPPPTGSSGVTWERLAAMSVPILWLTGDADLYSPPPVLQQFHTRTPGSELKIIHGAGHAPYWEQPGAFNDSVLDFLARH